MCFSPGASFGAGIALAVIGVASIKQAKKPSQRFFASIPLIFAVQQLVEGALWLALTDAGPAWLAEPATYGFLFFAQVVWPFWVPFSIYKLEERNNKTRRKFEKGLLVIGSVVSAYLLFCLLFYPVEGKALASHIAYQQAYPEPISRYGGGLYLIATILPPFFSGKKWMWTIGLAILIAYIVTLIFYENHIVSVWCYFAAVISILVWLVLWKGKREKTL
jgi:hypothetical protein